MRLGIIGLPNSGKTTIFNALTGGDYQTSAASTGQFEIHTATVTVPDQRIARLSSIYQPRKTIYTQIIYADIGGLEEGIGAGELSGQFRNELAQVDGFLHVLRHFDDERVPHPYGTIDPARDLATIDGEFLLLDLLSVESRLERIANELRVKGKKADQSLTDEKSLLEKLKAHLEVDQPLRSLELTRFEDKWIRGFGFLTRKPVLVVLNMGDEPIDVSTLIDLPYPRAALVGIQGALEAETAQLNPEDAALFMTEYDIT